MRKFCCTWHISYVHVIVAHPRELHNSPRFAALRLSSSTRVEIIVAVVFGSTIASLRRKTWYIGISEYRNWMEFKALRRENRGQTPASSVPTSHRATKRYSKIRPETRPRFPTLIGQLRRVPLFGTRPRRYNRRWFSSSGINVFWRARTASWRQK